MATSYPYRTDDRLYAAQLDWDLEFNPGPNPPGSPLGGAGMYKYWVDTSTALPTLRQCIVERAHNAYDAAEWMTVGVFDLGAGEFIFDPHHVRFPPQEVTLTGDVSGVGAGTIETTLAAINAQVGTFQGITVDAKGRVTMAVDMHYAPLESPVFTGIPQVPTPLPGSNSTRVPNTEWVNALFATGVQSFNERTGSVVLTLTDITDADGAPIKDPVFEGIPRADTAAPGTSTTQLATTAFVAGALSAAVVTRTIVSDTPPPTPALGDGWFDSTVGELFIWYIDPSGPPGQWVVANNAPLVVSAKYDISFSYIGGVLANNQLLGLHKVSKAITIPANFGPYAGHYSECGATANATASTVLRIETASSGSPNAFTPKGTITIAAGTVTPTFATAGGLPISMNAGDVLRFIGPAVADATLANVYATIVAQEA